MDIHLTVKKHKEYWSWVEKRNNERYKSNISHDKNYDAYFSLITYGKRNR